MTIHFLIHIYRTSTLCQVKRIHTWVESGYFHQTYVNLTIEVNIQGIKFISKCMYSIFSKAYLPLGKKCDKDFVLNELLHSGK